ncbi:hypothetical protein GDO81_018813, partial [Engystomops pustulosus]
GGYNMRSLAEGVCASLKILLGDPCPSLSSPFTPCESALDSISGAITVHRKYWRCLQDQDFTLNLKSGDDNVTIEEIRDLSNPEESEEDIVRVALDTAMQEVMRKLPEKRCGLVYDEQMMEHYNMWDSCHPELPQRISRIYKRHQEMGLIDRCTRLPHRLATTQELQMCHSPSYIKKIEESSRMKPRDLHRMGSEYNSIYINTRSYNSACLAAGSTFNVVEAVLKGEVQNGICIVRPPGHHAEPGVACGFCFFNNVALAARYAQSLQSPSEPPLRVMILDWDIHHGNGTQHIFQDDPSVLYVSLHRYDNGSFFPSSEDAAHEKVGSGQGEGFNVNIPWNGGKMGDVEYLLAFHRIVMPIAYEFNPQLVLVSAGFDAARGDPLGGCRISPEGYAHMTHLLMGLAGGKVVVVLEGGYNLTSISDSMAMCTRTLLGDAPPPITDLHAPRPAALRAISSVLGVQQKYWHSLRINAGPPVPSEAEKEVQFSPEKVPHSKNGEQGILSPQRRSPRKQIVSSPTVRERGEDDLTPQPSPWTPRTESTESSSPRSATSIDDSIKKNLGGDLVTSPSQDESTREGSVLSLTAAEDEDKDMDISAKTDQSYEGEALELVIELQVSDKTPEKRRSKPGMTVEELLRDLHLEDHTKSLDSRSPESDSKPVGGARKKTSMGRQSGGASQSEDKQDPVSMAKAKEGDHLVPYEADMDPALVCSGELFTVTPLSWCPHLESVHALPSGGLDVTEPCAECGTQVENWVCLTCYQVLCGRYVSQHMMCHGVSSGHNIVLSFSDLSVWCYSCDAYIHNEVLTPAKQSVYRSKFGEDMPRAAQSTDKLQDPAPLAEAIGGHHLTSNEADMNPSHLFSGELFTVTPLSWCPHLESVHALPSCGLDVTEPCAECGTQVENWVCLTCYQVRRGWCLRCWYDGGCSA